MALHAGRASDGSTVDIEALLDALQAMRSGDFMVRLPGNQTGIAGKVADTFNDIEDGAWGTLIVLVAGLAVAAVGGWLGYQYRDREVPARVS